MRPFCQEVKVQGIPICRGIAIGKFFLFGYTQDAVPEIEIHETDIEGEIEHYRHAIKCCENDVISLKKQLEIDGVHEGAAILEAHLQMMQDPLLTHHVEEEIRLAKKNAAYIFHKSIKEYQKKFSSIADPFFRERFKDLQSISRRIMGYLRKIGQASLADIPPNSVVFALELAASDSAEAKIGDVNAFVTQHGGITSHAAIVAKAKGIPYVANINLKNCKPHKESLVIVDGRTGDVVINPTLETLSKYRILQKQLADHFLTVEKAGDLKAETIDGYEVHLSANVDQASELENIHSYGSGGVGLFRSEYIFLSKGQLPDEEEQFKIYRDIVQKMRGLPIIIRTFDIGGDKFILNRLSEKESNPFLGCRAIRFLLKEQEVFKAQLRAILRAAIYGNVSIMFPMVSSLEELLEAKRIVKQIQNELESNGIHLSYNPRIGCMIEVPSAAIIADLLAKECDFLSIGTNDLVQYTLAVDRDNQAVSELYNPAHPSVLRLIKMIVSEADKHEIPVTLCGEVAADPRFTPLLLGLGIHLSISTRYIPTIKHAIRNISFLSASHLVEKVLSLTNAIEVQALLNHEYRKNVPNDFFYNC